MKRLWLFLISVGACLSTRPAEALPSETTFEVSLMDGPDPSDATKVATVSFRPTEDAGNGRCRYAAGWRGTYETAFSTSCSVDELKTHQHASCLDNAGGAFATMIEKPPRSDCAGFDTQAQARDIFLLVGIVIPEGPKVVGILQWSAAAWFLYAFEADPEP